MTRLLFRKYMEGSWNGNDSFAYELMIGVETVIIEKIESWGNT